MLIFAPVRDIFDISLMCIKLHNPPVYIHLHVYGGAKVYNFYMCAIYISKLFMQALEFRGHLECIGYSEPTILAFASTNILWTA